MPDANAPRDPELFRLVRQAIHLGLQALARLLAMNAPISHQYNWPIMSSWENGLPRFTIASSFPPESDTTPLDYTSAFRNTEYSSVAPRNEIVTAFRTSPVFSQLVEYCRNSERLRAYAFPLYHQITTARWNEPALQEMLATSILIDIESLIDRYMHVYGTTELTEQNLLELYIPRERWMLDSTLRVDFVVPILFLGFDFERLQLTDSVFIEKMPDRFQLSRISERGHDTSVNHTVLESASHALVLTGHNIQNHDYTTWANEIGRTKLYPVDVIDNFFAAARIVSGVNTGYAQLLTRPVDWTHRYKADLPAVVGTSIRRYPNWFEEFYWLRQIRIITGAQAVSWGHVFEKLSPGAGRLTVDDRGLRRLEAAIRRVNICYLRENDEDAVLDAVIGMEMLLTTDDHEVAHKLAMRVAALSKLYTADIDPPPAIFKIVKGVYTYRSKIAHGQSQDSKKRELTLGGGRTVRTASAALECLRMIMTVLLEHPEYLSVEKIDEDLLLDR